MPLQRSASAQAAIKSTAELSRTRIRFPAPFDHGCGGALGLRSAARQVQPHRHHFCGSCLSRARSAARVLPHCKNRVAAQLAPKRSAGDVGSRGRRFAYFLAGESRSPAGATSRPRNTKPQQKQKKPQKQSSHKNHSYRSAHRAPQQPIQLDKWAGYATQHGCCPAQVAQPRPPRSKGNASGISPFQRPAPQGDGVKNSSAASHSPSDRAGRWPARRDSPAPARQSGLAPHRPPAPAVPCCVPAGRRPR